MEAAAVPAVESARCECCGLVEDCTRDYILGVRAAFGGRWLCGLCSEAVRDEVARKPTAARLEEAVRDHMAFCGKCRRSPASGVADGMRQMLQRRSSLQVTSSIRSSERRTSSES